MSNKNESTRGSNNDEAPGSQGNFNDVMRSGGKNTISKNPGSSQSTLTLNETFSVDTKDTLNNMDTGGKNASAGTLVRMAQNSYDAGKGKEMNAKPDTNVFAASSRFGDVFTSDHNSILNGNSRTSSNEPLSLAYSFFGDELSKAQRNWPLKANTDDLTDDNDALTERTNSNTQYNDGKNRR